jgi:hypothetical protein
MRSYLWYVLPDRRQGVFIQSLDVSKRENVLSFNPTVVLQASSFGGQVVDFRIFTIACRLPGWQVLSDHGHGTRDIDSGEFRLSLTARTLLRWLLILPQEELQGLLALTTLKVVERHS